MSQQFWVIVRVEVSFAPFMELSVSDYSTMPAATLTLKGVLLRLSCFSAGVSSNTISTYSLSSVTFSVV